MIIYIIDRGSCPTLAISYIVPDDLLFNEIKEKAYDRDRVDDILHFKFMRRKKPVLILNWKKAFDVDLLIFTV